MKYPTELSALIATLKKFPGVGTKTAERFAFQLLKWERPHLEQFSALLHSLPQAIQPCPTCGCLMDGAKCPFCADPRRSNEQICIIASPKDAYAIEETGSYRGVYHVLGSLLSPLDGKLPEHLDLIRLKNRITTLACREIIIALDSTLEGDATSLYLKEQLQSSTTQVSRLAFGLPMGSSLDYVDGGTLARALLGRQTV